MVYIVYFESPNLKFFSSVTSPEGFKYGNINCFQRIANNSRLLRLAEGSKYFGRLSGLTWVGSKCHGESKVFFVLQRASKVLSVFRISAV